MMLETYAPAAVVTNRRLEPLYYFGATDRYMQIVAGEPNQDVLSMAREGLRRRTPRSHRAHLARQAPRHHPRRMVRAQWQAGHRQRSTHSGSATDRTLPSW